MSIFNFPFTDFHDLNFDWMLKCWRQIYDKIPSKLSQLVNDTMFIRADQAPVQSVNGMTGVVVIPDELFICTYGTTTNAEIEQAIADDLLICCVYNDRYYLLTHRDSATKHIFNIIENTSTGPHSYWLTCDTDTWSDSSMLLAKNASPALTGTPTAPTAATGTSTQQIATTAFVQQEISDLAPLEDPALTGIPTAPTAAAGTNTQQIATTAFVQAAMGEYITLLGDKYNINPVDDLDDFVTGIGLFINNAQTPIANFPPWSGATDAALIISAGETGNGVVQIAIPADNIDPPKMRVVGGSWSVLTDRVKSVNGQTGTVSLSAADVGAIPASNGIVVEDVTGVANTVNATDVQTWSIDVSKSGYTPLGMVGFNKTGSGASWVLPYRWIITGNTLDLRMHNLHSSNNYTVTPIATILYLKN